MLNLIKLAYLTVWFRVHPFTGDEYGRGVYMSWGTAYKVAQGFIV